MSARRVKVMILCEDTQQECFIRRFLKRRMGRDNRCFRVSKSPSASGSGEQYVRNKFPNELENFRNPRTRAVFLIAMIDADVHDVETRINDFRNACNKKNIPFRNDKEAVVIAVPKRNIETWIRYLDGEEFNEREKYPKLDRERDCRDAVKKLVNMCQTNGLPDNAPSSLKHACDEYNNRIKPLISSDN